MAANRMNEKWRSSSEGGSGSKPETVPAAEYVIRSTFRQGHKRELQFALKSLSEVSASSSLCRTRPKSKNPRNCAGEPSSVPASRPEPMPNVGPLTNKPPANPEELIASGWIDGASIKLVNDDEENGLFAMIEDGRIFCSCGTCRSVKSVSFLEFRQHGGCSLEGDLSDSIFFENNRTMREAIESMDGDSIDLLKLSIQEVVGPFPEKRTCKCQNCGELYHTSRICEFMSSCCSCLQMKLARAVPSTSSTTSIITSSLKRISPKKKNTSEKITKKNVDLHKLIFLSDKFSEGTEVQYLVKGVVQETGKRKGNGILCYHCNQVVTPTQFEQHAGQGHKRKPYNHIFVSENLSLHDLSVRMLEERSSASHTGCLGWLLLVRRYVVCRVTLKAWYSHDLRLGFYGKAPDVYKDINDVSVEVALMFHH